MSSVITYQCPNCGGDLKFNPKKSKFSCEFCLSDFTKEEIDELYKKYEASESYREESQNNEEEAPEDFSEDAEFAEHAVSFSCPNCGAKIITTDTTAATDCYYCHHPVVLEGRLSGEFKPDLVIPFSVSKEDAKQKFTDWCSSKRFLKRDFKNQNQLEKISGIYLPFWVVDAAVDGELDGIAKKVRSWRRGDTIYTETKTFSVERRGTANFKNLPRFALNTINTDAINSIWPFDLNKAEKFSMTYLSGFAAEKFELDKDNLRDELLNDARRYTEKMLRDSLGDCSSFIPHTNIQQVLSDKWKYVMLPVWILYSNYNSKTYCFAVNGQTGEVDGTLPVDPKKLALLFGGVFLAAFIIFMLLGGIIL